MKYIGGTEILSDLVKQFLQKQLSPKENVVYCISCHSTEPTSAELRFNKNGAQYRWFDTVVATDHRLICLNQKTPPTMFHKISDFTVESIEYLDIKRIETSTASGGVESVVTKLIFGGRVVNLLVNGKIIYQLPSDGENELKTFIDWLREKVHQSRTGSNISTNVKSPSSNIAQELEKLASLSQSGVLSNQEFEAAKKKLLGL